MTLHAPVPADVWCVRTTGTAARGIRLGTALRDLFHGGSNDADIDNHVIVVDHQTPDGVWWGVEGRPGGVGQTTLTQYMDDPFTITNFEQPKTDDQRAQILACVPQILGTPYDWTAIMVAAAADLHIPEMFAQNWKGQGAPGHLICSAVADWEYHHVGLANPAPDRFCTPADWVDFISRKGWL